MNKTAALDRDWAAHHGSPPQRIAWQRRNAT